MATINFLYRGTKDFGKISLRLTHGQEIQYRVSTSIESKKSYWFKRTTRNGKTTIKHLKLKDLANGVDEVKAHGKYLSRVKEEVLKAFVADYNNGIPITQEWLKSTIDSQVEILDTKDKVERAARDIDNIKNSNLLTNAVEKMFTKYQTNPNELKKYKVTLNRLKEFEAYKGKAFMIKDLNQTFADHFKNWAYLEMEYSKSYINAQLKRLRASVVYVYENDENDIIQVSRTLRSFNLFKEVYKDKIVLTLDYSELDKIDKTEIEHKRLTDAKKAILIGCETGLRYSDMNKLVDGNIKNIDGVNYWEFRTDKTDALVQITITERILYLINKYGLPKTEYPKNGVQFNRDIKKVCSKAGIDEKILATKAATKKVKGKNVIRTQRDYYKKYKLITSRTFRRSFATNYYGKIDTALIMNVTGHATEQMLRNYIDQGNTGNIARTKEQIDKYHEERKRAKNDIKLTKMPMITSA